MKRIDIKTKRNLDEFSANVKQSVHFIKSQTKARPRIALILGSGLGDLAETFLSKTIVQTSTIPHYPKSTVEGHRGSLIFGKLHQTPLLAFQGRVHFYESGILESVLYPIHVAHRLGITTLIVTNAAGGVNRRFTAGDLMLITDQINLTFENPLTNYRLSSVHKQLYDEEFQNIVLKVASEKSIHLQQGVYCGVKGPSYETAAEIEMIRQSGGDAVGMSTILEVSLANKLGMRVAGVSCITNLATGINDAKLSHAEVTEVANKVKQKFAELIREVIKAIA